MTDKSEADYEREEAEATLEALGRDGLLEEEEPDYEYEEEYTYCFGCDHSYHYDEPCWTEGCKCRAGR